MIYKDGIGFTDEDEVMISGNWVDEIWKNGDMLYKYTPEETEPEIILPESIKILGGVASIKNGNSVQLTAEILPENATDKTVTWSTSNLATMSISDQGLATAKATGMAVITAQTVNGISNTILIRVTV